MLLDIENITKDEIISKVKVLKEKGCRLVTITTVKIDEGYELTYHFDLDFNLVNLRYIAKQKEVLHSISPIYPGAFLIENEYQDLFGLKFNNLTIDYKGRLYLTSDSPEHPLAGASEAAKGA